MKNSLFAQELAKNDILLYNQNRQQGVGNIIASLYLGKKVFIRSDVTTYQSLHNTGFEIFDTLQIPAMNFQELIATYDNTNNKQKALMFFDDNNLKQLWDKIFTDE